MNNPCLIVSGYGQEADLLNGDGDMTTYLRLTHVDSGKDLKVRLDDEDFRLVLAALHDARTGVSFSEGGDETTGEGDVDQF